MIKLFATLLLFFTITYQATGQSFNHVSGQSFLYFKKNNNHGTAYAIGDIITFELIDKSKITDKIIALEDDSIIFQHYTIKVNEITALYLDEKTRDWFIFRYKYKQLFFLGGVSFLPIDIINTKKVQSKSLIISGVLLSAAFLADHIISERLSLKGKRDLLIISY